ncbi:MAG: hypothetical protein KDC54_07240, partial [Lewinella sp.]|nr:hypothetical protein [Lewinella sp.]
DMGYYGTLIFQEAPAKVGNNVSIIPYLSTRTTDDFNPETKQDWALDAGGDIKIGITPSLNLDLTYRPDFSQVEVDAQVTNLTRFNIFFPERRQFFIENNDIFSAFGQFADNPFYSRRIGLDANGRTVPIQYGARLTGNISERTRIGLLNMQTQSKPDRPGENYSAAVFQRRFWQRSSFSGIFLNRQSFDGGRAVEGNYGRNLGGEIAMSTPDSKWEGELGYLQSFKDGISGDNQHVYSHFAYSGQRFRTFLDLQHLGSNYYADMGFTGRLVNYDPDTDSFVRLGYTQVSNMIDFYTYPAHHPRVNFHWSGLENFVWINDETGLNEWYTRLRHFIFFQNTSELRFRLNNNFVDLIFPFGLTDTPLPVGDYNMTEFNVEFRTDQRRRLNTGWSVVYGQFFNGNKLTYEGNIRFRVQPWGNFTVGIEQNDIWLPEPYGNLHLTLASLRAEINFSTRLFWTTFLQYNTQADNFNINSRLQWRFAPMSDVFLVYTDNYRVAGIFGPKERTVALKVNYWLTL